MQGESCCFRLIGQNGILIACLTGQPLLRESSGIVRTGIDSLERFALALALIALGSVTLEVPRPAGVSGDAFPAARSRPAPVLPGTGRKLHPS